LLIDLFLKFLIDIKDGGFITVAVVIDVDKREGINLLFFGLLPDTVDSLIGGAPGTTTSLTVLGILFVIELTAFNFSSRILFTAKTSFIFDASFSFDSSSRISSIFNFESEVDDFFSFGLKTEIPLRTELFLRGEMDDDDEEELEPGPPPPDAYEDDTAACNLAAENAINLFLAWARSSTFVTLDFDDFDDGDEDE
jgi:hypothetical protein